MLRRNQARSAPMLVYGFPAAVCISVNEEIVHGIPSHRALEDGDLLKLDVTVEKHGYMADAAMTIGVGAVSPGRQALIDCAKEPTVPNYEDPGAGTPLVEGMVLAVEPILSMGSGSSKTASDGWTVRTADGALAAHYEQTIVITSNAPLDVTAAA